MDSLITRLRSALQELILNAVEHGCLELRYHDKIESVANDQYDAPNRSRKSTGRVCEVRRFMAASGAARLDGCGW